MIWRHCNRAIAVDATGLPILRQTALFMNGWRDRYVDMTTSVPLSFPQSPDRVVQLPILPMRASGSEDEMAFDKAHASPGPGKPTATDAHSSLSSACRSVWLASGLRQALGDNADDALEGAGEATFERGQIIYEMSRADPSPLFIVIEGLIRVYYMSHQGRQATIRYATTGDSIGLPVILAPDIIMVDRTLAMQALSPCRVLELSPPAFRRTAQSDARNMWPLFNALASMMTDSQIILSENVFLPVRARVARHLLDLAADCEGKLVVTASQQDIADAIGSVREVVSRVVAQLRDEGFLRREDGMYTISDPSALHRISQAD